MRRRICLIVSAVALGACSSSDDVFERPDGSRDASNHDGLDGPGADSPDAGEGSGDGATVDGPVGGEAKGLRDSAGPPEAPAEVSPLWADRTPCPVPLGWPGVEQLGPLFYDPGREAVVSVTGVVETRAVRATERWFWYGGSGDWEEARTCATGTERRWTAPLVFDRDRRVLVGVNPPGVAELDVDTWTWTDVAPASGESETATSAVGAYDPERKVLVFFTGAGRVSEWNAEARTWKVWKRFGTDPPWPTPSKEVVWDSKAKRVTVFTLEGGVPHVWQWNGDRTWSDRTPKVLPESWPSTLLRAAHDPTRGVTIFWKDLELWEWDGVAGTFADRRIIPLPSVWPKPVNEVGVAFDESRNRLVATGIDTWDDHLATQVWEWDPSSALWEKRRPASPRKPWPLDVSSTSAALDPEREKVMFFGGGGSLGATGETWEWDGTWASWRFLNPAPLPKDWPKGYGMLAFDSKRKLMMLFDDRVWSWESETWKLIPSSAGPGQIWSIVYDPMRDLFVVAHDVGAWEWSPEAHAWTKRTTSPAPAWGTPLVFDEDVSRVLGLDRNAHLWSLDAETGAWTDLTPKVPPASWPSARAGARLVFDATRKLVVLHGGEDEASTPLYDTWEWSSATSTWTARTPAPLPSVWPKLIVLRAAAFDPTRATTVMFGQREWGIVEAWEWFGGP